MQRRPSRDLAIECDDLSVARSGIRVAEGITFRLAAGAALAIMGPTGAGKSSLAALLAGADEPALALVGGTASVAGIPVRKTGRARRVRRYHTGYLAQDAGASLRARLKVGVVI